MQALQDFYPIVYTKDPREVLLLQNLRAFWSVNRDFWFSHQPITSPWPANAHPYTDTLDINLHLLLHYDQIFRHPGVTEQKNKQLGHRFASHLALHTLHSDQFAEAVEWEKVFILLTLRHNNSLLLKELALKKILQLAEETPSPLYLRFLKATILDVHSYKHNKGYAQELLQSPNPAQVEKDFTDILEKPKILQGFNTSSIYKTLYDAFHSTIKNYVKDRVAVSISGGVDSMVCARIGKEVCEKLNKELVLIHVNYNNRDTCDKECALLRQFAHSLGVPLYIRKITEMKRIRNTSLRELYESVTRDIRFSFYSYFNCPVILGHNLDDCFENAFTNLSKQIHHENLFGMRTSCYEQNVRILRPMLDIYKKDIIMYADHNNIPHLYDSTPSWSRRGQMRDSLIPGIRNFDPNILTGFHEFIKRTVFLEKQWTNTFTEWIQGLKTTETGWYIQRDRFFEDNYTQLNFWIQFWQLVELDHRPSNKSFKNLITHMNRYNLCTLNLHWQVHVHKGHIELQYIPPK